MSEKAPIKPGYKTTEFWLTVVASAIGLAMSSGAFPESGAAGRALGVVATGLAALGYSVSRGLAKR